MRLVVVLLLLSLAAAEEKWIPFGEREWKSGTRRLVINGSGFRFFDGEKLLSEGPLPQLPFEVHVLSNEPGAVLFEKYAEIGQGDTIAFLGADGKFRWRLGPDQIPGGAGDKVLRRLWWVDEARGTAVLVARSGALLDVDLKTAKVTSAAKDVVLPAFAMRWSGWDLQQVIEIAVETSPDGLREAAEKLFAKEDVTPDIRLLAAVAIETSGGEAVAREVWDAVLSHDGHIERRRDAIAFAGAHIADVALVEKTALSKDFGGAAVRALAKREATSELAGLLTNASVEPRVRAYAAELLGGQAVEQVLEAIDKEMKDADPEQAGALLTAAIATRAPDLERRLQHHEATLLKILDKETASVHWLAGYFRGRPTSEAVKPLVKALAKHKHEPALRRKITGALKTCSGEDHGDDVDAWIKALAARR